MPLDFQLTPNSPPHEGDTVNGYLVYLHLDVKIGLAQLEMIELGA